MTNYYKITTVSGYALEDKHLNEDGNYDTLKVYSLNGHWKNESVMKFSNRCKLDCETVTYVHHTLDMNKRGRGSRGKRVYLHSRSRDITDIVVENEHNDESVEFPLV